MQTKIKDKSKTTQNHQDNENGMIVERRFTTAGEDPFDLFSWISMDVEIEILMGLWQTQLMAFNSSLASKASLEKLLLKSI